MNVLVYTGPGTAKGPVDHTLLTLKTHLSTSYDVIPVDAPTLEAAPWQQTTSLLVIPGGRDLPYVEHLHPTATAAIRSWVAKGGRYLGICAGAYFACDRVEFEMGRKGYEVAGDRHLGFLKATARGSVAEGFVYGEEDGARAMEITIEAGKLGWLDEVNGQARAHVYVNGGPYFDIDANSMESGTSGETAGNPNVLAWYASDESTEKTRRPAIVECTVGTGMAILTGPHVEYRPDILSRHSANPHVSRILPSLIASDETRDRLVRSLLSRLGLKLNDQKDVASTLMDMTCPEITEMHLCPVGESGEEEVDTLMRALENSGKVGEQAVLLEDSVNVLCFRHNVAGEVDNTTSIVNQSNPTEEEPKPTVVINVHPSPMGLPTEATPKFNLQQYAEALKTARLSMGSPLAPWRFGSSILYGEVVSSTQTLLEKNLKFSSAIPSGLVCVGSHQVAGRGRGRNSWISQSGCLMFTLSLHHRDARSVVFIQYLVGLAIVEAIRGLPGCADLPVHLKWPNDLYAVLDDGPKKIGGILVTSSYQKGTFSLFIGCGVNVANAKPTLSINDLICQRNAKMDTNASPVPPITVEQVLAHILATFEDMYNEFVAATSDGRYKFAFEPFLERYYSRWLHSDQLVTLQDADNALARIVGLDSSGLLKAVEEGGGREYLLQPDGNSFDMMKGLISRKQ
ncbi:biotin holocarboxylase synthetase [Borealophlyctis nickersoniae]|nr:biotin holocarboxylase synthetase [Borealophlyctis nickersoniae]